MVQIQRKIKAIRQAVNLLLLVCCFLPATAQETRTGSERYLELVDSADYYISKELWGMAEKNLTEALRLEPANISNSLLLSNLGVVQFQKGEYKKAIDSYTLGLGLTPSSTVLLNNRAKAYLSLNSVTEAKKDIDKSLSIDSIQEWPLQMRGYIYLYDNDTENAEKLFKFIHQKFPKNALAYSGLADIEERKGNKEEAIKLYDKSLELDPEDQEVLISKIYLLIDTGKYTEARADLRVAINKFPEEGMFYLLRGYLHKLNYRTAEAQADKKTAIDKGIDPSYVNQFIP